MGVRDLGKWWSQDESTLQLTAHSTTTGSNKIGDFTVYQTTGKLQEARRRCRYKRSLISITEYRWWNLVWRL